MKYILEIKVNNKKKKISCYCEIRIHKNDTIIINKDTEFLEKYSLASVGYVSNCADKNPDLSTLSSEEHDVYARFDELTNLNLSATEIKNMNNKLNLKEILADNIWDSDLPLSPFLYLIFGITVQEIKNILETNNNIKEQLLEVAKKDTLKYYNKIYRELNNNGLIHYFLQQRYKNYGDLCFPKENIENMIDEINEYFKEYNYVINKYDVEEVFKNNSIDLFVQTDNCYYLKGNYYIQKDVIDALKELNISAKSAIKVQPITELTSEQNQALKNAIENKLSIINGGPGVGKSYTVKYLAEYLANNNKSVCVASLTARVAQKMQNSIKNDNIKCSTIHNLLNLNEFKKFNMINDITYNYVILEEASMININLFKYILTHLGDDTHLILVGDYNQLPAIGAGQVFRDLCKSKNVKKTILTKIFRQSEENSIVNNSYAILNGKQFDDLKQDKNFYKIDTKDTNMANAGIAIIEQFLRQRNLNVEDVTILASTKSLASSINFKIQNMYNKNPEIEGCLFRVGDKVMQNINNKEKEIWNGNVGTVVEILDDAKGNKNVIVNFGNKRIVYNKAAQKQLSLAYCYTVHKAQGMENDNVIILVDENEKLLNRNMIYTAITRAKETCVIIGKKQNIDNAIRNNLTCNGYSEIEL